MIPRRRSTASSSDHPRPPAGHDAGRRGRVLAADLGNASDADHHRCRRRAHHAHLGPRRRDRRLRGRADRPRAVAGHRHLPDHPDAAAADRAVVLPRGQRHDRHHRGPRRDRLGIRGPAAACAGARRCARGTSWRLPASAARRSAYIILVEILPNMLSLIVASFLGSAVYTVATAAGLQFLGLGNGSEITWGTMLHFAQQNGALESGNALWALAPGGGGGAPGDSVRAAELRVRRDRQPGPPAGRGGGVAPRCLRSAASRSTTSPTRATSARSTGSTSRSRPGSFSRSSASPAAASRRCSSRSPSSCRRRPSSPREA